MENTKTILITGGTGLVGTELCKLLVQKGYKIIVLSRSKTNLYVSPSISFAHWDINNNFIDRNAIIHADYIIHLAGAGVVDKKWTAAYKKEIQDSRIKSSELIVDVLKNNPHKVKAIISASAIGWYGADVKENYQFVESDPADGHFLGETCKLWEESIEPTTKLGIRVCKIRTGIVLSTKGGALKEFMNPIKFGLATILGNGKQIVSWIHIEDICRIFIHAIENEQLTGSYNAVSPNPVSNKTLTVTLAKIMRGIFFIPVYVPKFILKIMMGERSIEVLKSADVNCEKIRTSGFVFLFPGIEVALKNLLRK
ncbi:MAG: TIGR01777 family oxidoreductase [Bacteroidota bacterium]